MNQRKYPHLEWYIASSRFVAAAEFALCLVPGLIGFLVWLMQDSPSQGAAPLVGISVVLLVGLVVGYIAYMLTMAGADFLCVFRDIEENTRSRPDGPASPFAHHSPDNFDPLDFPATPRPAAAHQTTFRPATAPPPAESRPRTAVVSPQPRPAPIPLTTGSPPPASVTFATEPPATAPPAAARTKPPASQTPRPAAAPPSSPAAAPPARPKPLPNFAKTQPPRRPA